MLLVLHRQPVTQLGRRQQRLHLLCVVLGRHSNTIVGCEESVWNCMFVGCLLFCTVSRALLLDGGAFGDDPSCVNNTLCVARAAHPY